MKTSFKIFLISIIVLSILLILSFVSSIDNNYDYDENVNYNQDYDINVTNSSRPEIADIVVTLFSKYRYKNISTALNEIDKKGIIIKDQAQSKNGDFIIITYIFKDNSSINVSCLIDGMFIDSIKKR